MDIGTEKPPIIVEPLEDPFPETQPTKPAPVPETVPA